ncbi:BBE domain-containing protein [Streptomyces sp. INA 01156]
MTSWAPGPRPSPPTTGRPPPTSSSRCSTGTCTRTTPARRRTSCSTATGRDQPAGAVGRRRPQRDSVVKSSWFSAWQGAELDELHLGWLRGLYEEFFAGTGGVPVTGGRTDGCYINYPDADLLDPARNRSEQPWHHLYYKENYARLQSAKRTWDPLNIFHHRMSIGL